MSAVWSDDQREWLQAMGFEVLVPAGASVDMPASAPVEAIAPTSARRPASATPMIERSDAPAVRAAASTPAAPDLTDPLLRALLRASRCDDLVALARLAGDLGALRRDPVAKRALWPRLRALRIRSRR